MILGDFLVAEEDGKTRFACTVFDKSGSRPLWFLREGHPLIEEDKHTVNWAAAAMIMPAMMAGEDLEIRGVLSERFFHFLKDELQTCLSISDPRLKRIKVTCDGLTTATKPATNRVATGFSAGVDSFATFAMHNPNSNETTLRITDLATFGVGSMGQPDDPAVKSLFDRYAERTKAFADRHSLGAFSNSSNVAAFYDGMIYEDYYAFPLIAAALTSEAHIDYYLLSSSEDLSSVGKMHGAGVCFFEPVILPMLSTERISLVTSGTSLIRFEKTKLIAAMKDAAEFLDVCQNPAPKRVNQPKSNCSRCTKCMRTMTTLDLLSCLDDFDQVFDVEFYRRHKSYVQYRVYKHAGRGSTLDREVVDAAIKVGNPLPRAPYIPALFYLKRAKEKSLATLM